MPWSVMKTISFHVVQQKPRTLAFFIWNKKTTSTKQTTRHLLNRLCSFQPEDRRRRASVYLTLLGELGVRVVGDEVDEILQRPETKTLQTGCCTSWRRRRCALIGWPTHHGLEGPLHRQDLVPDGELDALDFPFVVHPEDHAHVNTHVFHPLF